MGKKSRDLGLVAVDTHMGVFDYTVRVIFGEHENALKYIAHVFEDKYDDLPDGNRGYEARGVTFYKTGYVPIIWMPAYPKTSREYATFSHEVIHAVYHLFDWGAVPLTRDTEEVFAHSVAHVIDNVLAKAIKSDKSSEVRAKETPNSELAPTERKE